MEASMYWGHHYWGMHVFWWIFWILVVIGLAYWLAYWLRPAEPKRHDSAVETLRRSYAAGEISEEEYRHRLAVLTGRDEPAQRTAGPG
jgi:putative membrane protein